jgi:hypothetical protein
LSLIPLFQFNFLVFKSCKLRSNFLTIFLFSAAYFIYLPLANFTTLLLLLTKYRVNFVKITSLISGTDFISSTLSSFFVLAFLRFSFSGKGYRVLLSKNFVLTFSFGFSHLYYFYSNMIKVILSTKTKGYLLGLNSFLLVNNLNSLVAIKPINIFT